MITCGKNVFIEIALVPIYVITRTCIYVFVLSSRVVFRFCVDLIQRLIGWGKLIVPIFVSKFLLLLNNFRKQMALRGSISPSKEDGMHYLIVNNQLNI